MRHQELNPDGVFLTFTYKQTAGHDGKFCNPRAHEAEGEDRQFKAGLSYVDSSRSDEAT